MQQQDQPLIENFNFWDDTDSDYIQYPGEEPSGDGLNEQDSGAVLNAPTSKRATIGFDAFAAHNEHEFSPAVNQWFLDNFPDLNPSVPVIADRRVDIGVSNPFAVDQVILHPRMKSRPVVPQLRSDGAVNGLIKFRYHVEQGTAAADRNASSSSRNLDRAASEQQDNPFLNPCPNLPKDFGRGMKLSATDANLLRFYTVAFCSGRTLLPGSNGFLNDITPMAARNNCVKHALLALAATYVLDYLPSKELEKIANMHHKRAVITLGQALNDEKTYTPGGEDAVVGALALMSQNDLVNWETDRERSKTPEWLTGNQIATMVLDKSDPGYRFNSPFNVQSSKARKYLGNKIAFNEILCSVAAPLPEGKRKCPYPWLLEGDEKEVRRIDGLNGLAAKLLHTYAQITHLATRIRANPTTTVAPMVGRILESKLHNFQQWSDFSEAYITPEIMLEECKLDIFGKVVSPVDMTNIIAESYVASAQIYLQCRLFREVLRKWFTGVISSTRGNVPPAWRAMQMVWTWQDDTLALEEHEDELNGMGSQLDDVDFTLRRAWWEEMVWEVEKTEGRLSLS
ncbi:MAG: hypothetical protein Q9218_006414 [Villophora microphyllina]